MTRSTLTSQDWSDINTLFDASQLLRSRGLLSAKLWRSFHCICCRRIWSYITHSDSRQAVETAERYLDGGASLDDLNNSESRAARVVDDAWAKVRLLQIHGDPNTFVWPISEEVDDAWLSYCAASAARECVARADKEPLFLTTPVTDIRAWRDARPEIVRQFIDSERDSEDVRKKVLQRWEEIRTEDELSLIKELRKLVQETY